MANQGLLTAQEARQIAQGSEAEFQRLLDEVGDKVRAAAANGLLSTELPHIVDGKMRERVTDSLVILGFTVSTPNDRVFPIIKW